MKSGDKKEGRMVQSQEKTNYTKILVVFSLDLLGILEK